MRRFIFDEVATFEEATVDGSYGSLDSRYCFYSYLNSVGTQIDPYAPVQWLKLTTLDGTPVAIAEATELIGRNALQKEIGLVAPKYSEGEPYTLTVSLRRNDAGSISDEMNEKMDKLAQSLGIQLTRELPNA